MKSKTFSATEPLLGSATKKVDEECNLFLEENPVTIISTSSAMSSALVNTNAKITHWAYSKTLTYEPKL